MIILQAVGYIVLLALGLGAGWLLWGQDQHCPHTQTMPLRDTAPGEEFPNECTSCGRRLPERTAEALASSAALVTSGAVPRRVIDRTNRHLHRYHWEPEHEGGPSWVCECGDTQSDDRLQPA